MKGICFIEPLFLAVEDGTKIQTRRMMVPQPGPNQESIKPRYRKNELVYLKEPYVDDLKMERTFYKYCKEDIEALKVAGLEYMPKAPGFWKNKLFMPESQRRYVIRINDIRADRLQNISEADCIKEGIVAMDGGFNNRINDTVHYYAITAYAELIDSINGKGTWYNNPWVFVYDFEIMPV